MPFRMSLMFCLLSPGVKESSFCIPGYRDYAIRHPDETGMNTRMRTKRMGMLRLEGGCLKQYVEILIREGLETAISCPDAGCPKRGHLQENEIECMVASEIMQKYKKLQFEREVLLDPCRTWCPSSSCQAVCKLQEKGPQNPQLVQCSSCDTEFCSACKSNWHPGQGCQETLSITFLPGESSSVFKVVDDDVPIKRCPKCKVYIERDEGCAQMMCKNCKHAFCWYCLESLDDDFLLIHYDKGPCRNKLGHSRASVIWHRTQVVGIFAGFGLLLLVASPFLLMATPFILCCKVKYNLSHYELSFTGIKLYIYVLHSFIKASWG
uniref:RBR-type E3 ubiquitin transferase n=1 Tax=Leptobrachium leishanense TaxID=445787 RepID=A0A8C5QC10_9ANUR